MVDRVGRWLYRTAAVLCGLLALLVFYDGASRLDLISLAVAIVLAFGGGVLVWEADRHA